MSDATKDFTIRFRTDVAEAEDGLGQVEDAAQAVDSAMHGAAGGADEAAQAIGGVRQAAKPAAQAVGDMAGKAEMAAAAAANAARDLERAAKQTKNAGDNMRDAAPQADDFSKSLGKVGSELSRLGGMVPGVAGDVVRGAGQLLQAAGNPVAMALSALQTGVAIYQRLAGAQEAALEDARKHQEALDRSRESQLGALGGIVEKLQEIDDAEEATNRQRALAAAFVEAANGAYGEQILQIDRITGKVTGLNMLRARLELEKYRLVSAPLEKEAAAIEAAIPTEEEVRASMVSESRNSASGFGGTGAFVKSLSPEDVHGEWLKRTEKDRARLDELRAALKTGRLEFILDSSALGVLAGAQGDAIPDADMRRMVSDAHLRGGSPAFTEARDAYNALLRGGAQARVDAAVTGMVSGEIDADAMVAAVDAALALASAADRVRAAYADLAAATPDPERRYAGPDARLAGLTASQARAAQAFKNPFKDMADIFPSLRDPEVKAVLDKIEGNTRGVYGVREAR